MRPDDSENCGENKSRSDTISYISIKIQDVKSKSFEWLDRPFDEFFRVKEGQNRSQSCEGR